MHRRVLLTLVVCLLLGLVTSTWAHQCEIEEPARQTPILYDWTL